jgi:hypothetical protein
VTSLNITPANNGIKGWTADNVAKVLSDADVRREFFKKNFPASTGVQVAALLLLADDQERNPQLLVRIVVPRDADDLMRISTEIANRINFQLPHFFGVLPRNTYAVTFIPSALETGSSGYWAGNPQQGVAGQVLLRRTGAEQRTLYDLEMLEQMGRCKGIENYSRHLSGRKAGEPPPTLLDYFPKDFLLFVDESHQTVPQIGAMFKGDRSRKETLVEHGASDTGARQEPVEFPVWNRSVGPRHRRGQPLPVVGTDPGNNKHFPCHPRSRRRGA